MERFTACLTLSLLTAVVVGATSQRNDMMTTMPGNMMNMTGNMTTPPGAATCGGSRVTCGSCNCRCSGSQPPSGGGGGGGGGGSGSTLPDTLNVTLARVNDILQTLDVILFGNSSVGGPNTIRSVGDLLQQLLGLGN